jgi:hypothetical protein
MYVMYVPSKVCMNEYQTVCTLVYAYMYVPGYMCIYIYYVVYRNVHMYEEVEMSRWNGAKKKLYDLNAFLI